MTQFLYCIRPTRTEMLVESTPQEDRIVGEPFEYLRGLSDRGVVLLAGRTLNTDASAFGIVVFVAATEREAEALVQADPAVRAGVFDAQLFPYRVALVSDALLTNSD